MRHFLRRVAFYANPYKRQTILLVAGMIVGVVYDTMMPFSFKFLIDDAIVPRNWRILLVILSTLAAGGVLVSLIGVGRDYLYAQLSASMLKDVRLRIFRHLQDVPIEFYGRTRPGEITATFSTDLASVENAIVLAFPVGIMACMATVLSIIILFILQREMALVALAGLLVCVVGPKLLERKTAESNIAYKNEQARLLAMVEENIRAQGVIKTFNLKGMIVRGFRRQTAMLSRAAMRANFLSFMMERTPGVGILIFHIIVICAGAVLAFSGDLSVGALVSFNAVFVGISRSVYEMTAVFPQLMQARAGMDRIELILSERTASGSHAQTDAILKPLDKEIVFRDVSFGYDKDHAILHDMNITIPMGSTVAFVGSSGSGKTTAINLLMRLYNPWNGSIEFDGVDICNVTPDSLRAQMGVVLQENFLFNMSIRENIRLGKPDAGEAEIHAAAKGAEFENSIAGMKKGYDTVVGEHGGKLSGGQRQRVAIARALIRDPRVLILDEATSALDPATESAVNDTLRKIGRKRTVVSVTHRLSSIVHADRIYVFEGGRIVEQGTHENLLAMKGQYHALWRKQSGFMLSGDGEAAGVSAERLKLIPILADLNGAILDEISGLFVTEHYPENRVILEQEEAGDKFYIIVRGRVKVSKRADDGSEVTLNTLEDGDYFGEIALLKSVPRTATATTTAPTILLTLRRDVFLSLMERVPDLRRVLEERLERY